jgi:ABC-type multidrug transport system ATPase subunit
VHELALEARALTKRFGKAVALDGLDLQVHPGESVAILGAGSAGKSTALRLFAGLALPSSGEVLVHGVRSASRAGLDARGSVGFVPQEPGLYLWMTARELLEFGASLLGMNRRDVDGAVGDALERVGLADAADQAISAFGMPWRQRLSIAQALLGAPELMLFDEPLEWLDGQGQDDALAVLEQLRGAAAIVLATSDVDLAAATCERIVVLDQGVALAAGPATAVLDSVGPRAYVFELAPSEGLAQAGLVARLASERWVRDVSSVNGTLRVEVRDERRAERELLPAIVATGIGVEGMRRVRPELDEVVARQRADR